MSLRLLDDTRKINRLLHNNPAQRLEFDDICGVLGDILSSNIFVASAKGKILGIAAYGGIEPLSPFLGMNVGSYLDEVLNNRLLAVLSTNENVNLLMLGFEEGEIASYYAMITPIEMSGERLGTMFQYRRGNPYSIHDIILSEYGTTVVGLEMLRSVKAEDLEESRSRQSVEAAVSMLSSMEIEAVSGVLKEIGEEKGTLVASRLAEKTGITRSIIVNALRKLAGAGIIEVHSAGKKGTSVTVLNPYIYLELSENQRKME